MPETVIAVVLLAACLGYGVFCLVRRWLFIRNHKVCPNCGHQMNVLWIGEDIDPREESVTTMGYVIAGEVTRYTSLLRCKHCGHEIPLATNNSERG